MSAFPPQQQPPGRGPGQRGSWPWVLAGGLVLLVLAVVGTVVAIVALSSGDGGSDQPAVASSSGRAGGEVDVGQLRGRRTPTVPFGETVTVRDLDGEQAKVTTLALTPKDPPKSALIAPPKPGFHLVGLRIRLLGAGRGAFEDYVDTDTQILAGGRAYDSLPNDYPGCPMVDSDHRLERYEEESGCLLFSIPRSPQPSAVRYRPAGDSGPDVATWTLR